MPRHRKRKNSGVMGLETIDFPVWRVVSAPEALTSTPSTEYSYWLTAKSVGQPSQMQKYTISHEALQDIQEG